MGKKEKYLARLLVSIQMFHIDFSHYTTVKLGAPTCVRVLVYIKWKRMFRRWIISV